MSHQIMAVENGKPVKMWTEGVPVEDDARRQLANTARMPFIYGHLAVMPDVHLGKGSTIGKYTGLYYTFSMTAQIITPIVSGAVLEFISYRYLFPYAAFFEFVGIITMLFVHHGDSRPQPPKTALEAFDVED